MAYSLFWPDLLILLGARAILSLVGIILIVACGTFGFDKRWDDEGSAEVASTLDDPRRQHRPHHTVVQDLKHTPRMSPDAAAAAAAAAAAQQQDSYINIIQITANGSDRNVMNNIHNNNDNTISPEQELYQRLEDHYCSWTVTRHLTMWGWALLGFSLLLDCHYFLSWKGLQLESSLAILLMVLLAVVQVIILPEKMVWRKVDDHSYFFTCTQLLGMIVLGLLLAFENNGPGMWVGPLGGFLVAMAPFFYWNSRKMGECYDRTGRPSNGTVFHPGGICLPVGWFLLWLAMNGVQGHPTKAFLPIYSLHYDRTVVVVLGISLILLVQWVVGYAQDESTSDDVSTNPNTYMHGRGMGMAGCFCGRVHEVKYVMVLAWIVLSISVFMPTYVTTIGRPLLLCINIILQGIATAMQYEKGLRAGNARALSQWDKIVLVLYVTMIGLIYWNAGWIAAVFATLGVVAITIGGAILHRDRKRGMHWIIAESYIDSQTIQGDISPDTINPDYTVFSVGPPLYTTGMILLAWGLSIPDNQ